MSNCKGLYCRDCLHCRPSTDYKDTASQYEYAKCAHPKFIKVDCVTGKHRVIWYCDILRDDECAGGKYWEGSNPGRQSVKVNKKRWWQL